MEQVSKAGSKDMIGLYTWHKPYRKPLPADELMKRRQFQAQRARSRREALENGRLALVNTQPLRRRR